MYMLFALLDGIADDLCCYPGDAGAVTHVMMSTRHIGRKAGRLEIRNSYTSVTVTAL